jgi:hypothetical protein
MKYPFINYISKQWPKIPYTCYKLPHLRKMKEMPNIAIAIKYFKMHLARQVYKLLATIITKISLSTIVIYRAK